MGFFASIKIVKLPINISEISAFIGNQSNLGFLLTIRGCFFKVSINLDAAFMSMGEGSTGTITL